VELKRINSQLANARRSNKVVSHEPDSDDAVPKNEVLYLDNLKKSEDADEKLDEEWNFNEPFEVAV
jgi:hypothetical protein